MAGQGMVLSSWSIYHLILYAMQRQIIQCSLGMSRTSDISGYKKTSSKLGIHLLEVVEETLEQLHP